MTSTSRTASSSITIQATPLAPSVAPLAPQQKGVRPKASNVKSNGNLEEVFSEENDLEAMAAQIRKHMGGPTPRTTRDQIQTLNAMRRALDELIQEDDASGDAEAVKAILDEMLSLIGVCKFHVSSTYIA